MILKHILWMLCLLISYSKFTRTEVYEKLLNILPNDTILFEKEHDQANQRGKEMNISVDPIFMQEYISEHYPKLI